MRCYFKLVGSDQTITDEEGLEVADVEDARTLARAAVTELLQEAAAEIARWRGCKVSGLTSVQESCGPGQKLDR